MWSRTWCGLTAGLKIECQLVRFLLAAICEMRQLSIGSSADYEDEFWTLEGVCKIVTLNFDPIQIHTGADLISMGFHGADRPRYWYSHGDFGSDTGHDEIGR